MWGWHIHVPLFASRRRNYYHCLLIHSVQCWVDSLFKLPLILTIRLLHYEEFTKLELTLSELYFCSPVTELKMWISNSHERMWSQTTHFWVIYNSHTHIMIHVKKRHIEFHRCFLFYNDWANSIVNSLSTRFPSLLCLIVDMIKRFWIWGERIWMLSFLLTVHMIAVLCDCFHSEMCTPDVRLNSSSCDGDKQMRYLWIEGVIAGLFIISYSCSWTTAD